MRIGYMTPRINGISMAGLGDPTVAGIVSMDLSAYTVGIGSDMEHGLAISPDRFKAVLYDEVRAICMTWPRQCVDADAMIADAVAQYTVAYTREYNRVQTGIANGTIAFPYSYVPLAPPPNYVAPPNVNPGSNPNALDTTAPQPVYVNPVQPGNVLNPPQPLPPVYSTNAGSVTGNPGNTINGPSILDSISGDVDIAGFNVPLWALLAGGVGLFFLMGRR